MLAIAQVLAGPAVVDTEPQVDCVSGVGAKAPEGEVSLILVFGTYRGPQK